MLSDLKPSLSIYFNSCKVFQIIKTFLISDKKFYNYYEILVKDIIIPSNYELRGALKIS